MGFFTKENYNYWRACVTENRWIVQMIEMDTKEQEKVLQQIIDKVQAYDKRKNELKTKRRNTIVSDELSRINREILDIENQYRIAYAEGKGLEEKLSYYNRYHQITYQITRLKDIYSRQEAVRIDILNKGVEDGCIITSSSEIGEDIYKLEKYGIAMSPLYFDELAKIIKSNYFEIEPTERDYIDNEISQTTTEVFVDFCRQKMGRKIEDYLSSDNDYYDVKTTDITSWYKECPLRRYSLRDIKEAMIIYGYVSKPTKGRTDCTIAGQKVIRFYRNIMDKLTYVEGENE